MYLDTDGTLLNNANLPADVRPLVPWTLGKGGATWHSGVENNLFDPRECTYVGRPPAGQNVSAVGLATSNDGVLCSPSLTFRRVMLNSVRARRGRGRGQGRVCL